MPLATTYRPGTYRRVCPLRRELPKPAPAKVNTPRTPKAPGDAVRVTTAIMETLNGRRSLSTLHGWITEEVKRILSDHIRDHRLFSAQIASIRTQMPRPDAAEAAIRLVVNGRSTACALRLDRRAGRWIVTALALPPTV